MSPISYQEIEAWSQLSGNEPDPDEVHLLRIADRIILAVHNDSN